MPKRAALLRSSNPPPLRVEQDKFDRLVFWVESSATIGLPEWIEQAYRVDFEECHLVENGQNIYNGRCNCRDFDCRHMPELKLGKMSRCKHIESVLDFLREPLFNHYVRSVMANSHIARTQELLRRR